MITFEYEVKGIPFLLEWLDFIVTSKNGEYLGGDATGFLLDETDYAELANAISDVGNSITDFSTLLGNEVTARSEGDEFLQEQLFLLDERINNLLFDPVDNSDVMDGARKYVSDFIEVFSTDQVDGLNQKFALFTNVLNSKLSDINASAGTGLLIDKSNPAFPLITQNRPAWNQVQNKPMLFPPEAHNHSVPQINGLLSLLEQKVNNVEKGAALGVASLDASGKVPASQLPALNTSFQIVNTIADRNALTPTVNLLIYVKNATSDPTVSSGGAFYLYELATETWIKVSEIESMDIIQSWENITGKPTSFNPSSHGHSQSEISGLETLLASLQTQIDALTSGGTSLDAIRIYSGWFTDQWFSRTSAVDNAWRSVCWSHELNLFVAVASSGTGNRVMTSPDGITWTSRTSAVDNAWNSVCWSPALGLFVAVSTSGTSNRVMTSPDGIAWTSRTTPNNNWSSVCWSPALGLFVAVAITGTSNRVMTSPDGITWTSRTSASDDGWRSVCWSAELSLFVAVADSGTGNRVMTSSDGINWTSRTSAVDNAWMSVCWSAELSLFVAVANTGTGNRVMTSSNGITWTSRTSPADYQWNSVCWSPALGLFVAVSFDGTGNRIMTSPNGINWSLRTSAVDNAWMSVCWSQKLGIFVAVAITGTGNRVMTTRTLGLGHT
ncbi:hypothetical protein CH354_10070 [Leptospira levettii]|uniref:hypothetical protein n=1 Tax=Leptospira levettii TaxID=2023178 RepID=UPI000C2A94BA|nr:hypothetical protein [Leptospira levettii]PJZ37397.1 hypothetical protein CH354_10070 [Leptospira levettii]